MSRPTRLDHGIDAWLAQHEGWTREGPEGIARTYRLANFPSALAFVVRIGCLAEKRDHHPEILLTETKVRVVWATQGAEGVTSRDIELAAATDALFG